MKIEIRLFATLREGRGKVVYLEVSDEGCTPQHLMDLLNIPKEDVAILLINGRDGAWDRILVQEDYLSVFPPVGGG